MKNQKAVKAPKNKALDWIKRCANSNGISHMIPEKYQKDAETLLSEVEALNAIKKDLVKRDAEFAILRDNFWHNIKKHLEANGVKDVFEKSIDFDIDAKNEGFLVVNLYDERQGQPMGRPMRM